MSKKLLIDNRFFTVAEKKWGNTYEIIPSYMCRQLQEPVCCHPDLTLCQIQDIYIAAPSAYAYYKDVLKGTTVLCGETALSSHYPLDIAYNVLISEKIAFANFSYTDNIVKQTLAKHGISCAFISQGYARCSSTIVGDGVISADPSVIRACMEHGVAVLKIEPGDVLLSGYDYGFLGGASGCIEETVFFFGDITKHKNYKEIKQFIYNRGFQMEYIEDFPLTDVGTIIGIDCK